jgi:hypothetical protein
MNDFWTQRCRFQHFAVGFSLLLATSCASDASGSTAMDPESKPRAQDKAERHDSASHESTPPESAPQTATKTEPERKPDEMPATGASSDVAPEDSIDKSGRIIEQCQGMKLAGMKYSPGGTTLPNMCATFDVRDNNPYAVRCIDALPNFHTPFPGDEYCILPPPPELGFQVGVHPGGNIGYWEKMWAGDYSVYEDAKVTDPYVVQAGGESLQNYLVEFEGPTDERYYYRRYFRGRYGSHHGTVSFTGSPVKEGWQDNGDVFLGRAGELITVQNAYTDIPQRTMDSSPEEKGIGIKLTPNSGLNLNLHHFNATDKPLLRENWINAWYIPKAEVTRQALPIIVDTPINYPAGMELDNDNKVRASTETQVLSLWGHRHAWTTRFHAWIVRMDGSQQIVYDSNDWYDMPTFSYNSLAKNPEPGNGADGASSGPLVLHPGDELHFNCHIDTTKARADALGVDAPKEALEWKNEAFAGEMCLLMGQTTGGRLFGGFTNFDPSRPRQ